MYLIHINFKGHVVETFHCYEYKWLVPDVILLALKTPPLTTLPAPPEGSSFTAASTMVKRRSGVFLASLRDKEGRRLGLSEAIGSTRDLLFSMS